MAQDISFAKGDYLVEHGIVFQVVAIKKQENFKGEEEDFILYEPCFNNNPDQRLQRATPVSSLGLTNLRRLISQEEAQTLLESLTEPVPDEDQLDQKRAKEVIHSNALTSIAELVNRLWQYQIHPDKTLTTSKKMLMQQAMDRLTEELSVVFKLEIEDTHNTILKHLDKSTTKIRQKAEAN